MTGPTVTVLTAVRNGERFLGETIASIRAQTFEDWEYVIVDDASEDATRDVIAAAGREEPRIRSLLLAAPKGPYGAANAGLAISEGRFISRIDADDRAPADRLQRQVAFMQ